MNIAIRLWIILVFTIRLPGTLAAHLKMGAVSNNTFGKGEENESKEEVPNFVEKTYKWEIKWNSVAILSFYHVLAISGGHIFLLRSLPASFRIFCKNEFKQDFDNHKFYSVYLARQVFYSATLEPLASQAVHIVSGHTDHTRHASPFVSSWWSCKQFQCRWVHTFTKKHNLVNLNTLHVFLIVTDVHLHLDKV